MSAPRPVFNLPELRRWFESARAEVARLETIARPKTEEGRRLLEKALQRARSALSQRRSELDAAEAREARR